MFVLPLRICHSLRLTGSRRRGIVIPLTIALSMLLLTFLTLGRNFDCFAAVVKEHDRPYPQHTNVVVRNDGKVFKYDRDSPLIFISGTEHSGSDLLRQILNYHPDIRCTNENHFMHKLLQQQKAWTKHKNESIRLGEAGITHKLLEIAIGSFSLEIMARSGPPVEHLCNEDFHSVEFAPELLKIYPHSKFLLVVRDPMYYAYKKSKEHNPASFNETLFKGYLNEWEEEVQHQRIACDIISVGSYMNHPRCQIVIFEHLFLRPTSVVLQVLEFIFPNDSLHYIPHCMRSRMSFGLNDDLLEWVKHVPEHFVKHVYDNGRVNFLRFGYSQLGYPPNYNEIRWE